MPTKITGTVSGEPLIEVEIGGVFVPWKQGIDNWASVTAVTGSPQSATYTDADGTWNGSVVAGKGYGVANSGSGAYVNEPGTAGVVIIRVPSRFALV